MQMFRFRMISFKFRIRISKSQVTINLAVIRPEDKQTLACFNKGTCRMI